MGFSFYAFYITLCLAIVLKGASLGRWTYLMCLWYSESLSNQRGAVDGGGKGDGQPKWLSDVVSKATFQFQLPHTRIIVQCV